MTPKHTKTQRSGIGRFSTKLFQIILYIPIQLIFMPFAILGILVGLYKEMGNSKKLGVSFSAG
jgi:cobalamin biosynthesis protein CobD/CbiB